MEEWKKVNNTNGMIEVSNMGRVRSFLRNRPYVLKTQSDQKGYQRVSITINKIKYTFKLHRLVAEAFIDNPNNLPQVNHKDGNKNNNNANNLEWISNKDNANHAINNHLWDSVIQGVKKENQKRQKSIVAFNSTNKIVFKSVADAERFFNSKHITDVLKGKRKQAKGYSFIYESEVMPNGNNIF